MQVGNLAALNARRDLPHRQQQGLARRCASRADLDSLRRHLASPTAWHALPEHCSCSLEEQCAVCVQVTYPIFLLRLMHHR